MAAPKGHPRYGGRSKGTPNKRTKEMQDAAREAREKARRVLGDNAFDGDAHGFLTLVYRDPSLPLEVRLDAAKTAISYETPRLASIDATVVTEVVTELTADQRRERARREIRAAFSERTPAVAQLPSPPALRVVGHDDEQQTESGKVIDTIPLTEDDE